jgi:hypothetical protein
MSYVVLLVPSLLSLALLGAILLLREHQNAVIQKSLIDRLLVSQGHNPIPDIDIVSDITGEAKKQDIAEKIEEAVAKIKRMKRAANPVSFQIPGMPRSGMGDVKRG